MTKLKTQWEIFKIHINNGHQDDAGTSSFMLQEKAEAIKWIKKLKKAKQEADETRENEIVWPIFVSYLLEEDEAHPVIDFIKHFFNITEEELE